MYSNIIYTIFGNSKRIISALGGGNRLNAVENTTIGAFFCKTFNYPISPIYQQIAIIKLEYIKKKLAKKLVHPLASVS